MKITRDTIRKDGSADPTKMQRTAEQAGTKSLLGNQAGRRQFDALNSRVTVEGSNPLLNLDEARDMLNRTVGTITVGDHAIVIRLSGGKQLTVVEAGDGLQLRYGDFVLP